MMNPWMENVWVSFVVVPLNVSSYIGDDTKFTDAVEYSIPNTNVSNTLSNWSTIESQ